MSAPTGRWDVEDQRFLFIDPVELKNPEGPWLSVEESHHALRVLRLRTGDTARGVDGEGHEVVVAIGSERGRRLRCTVLEEREAAGPPAHDIALGLPLLHHPTRLDWLLEKATELGVDRFWPVVTKRTTVVPVAERAEKRFERWNRLIISAMKQSGRAWRPRLESPRPLLEILESLGGRRLLWATPKGGPLPPGSELRAGASDGFLLLVGPEGGWEEEEEERLAGASGVAVSLGDRRLRSETAVVSLMSLLQDRLRDAAQGLSR